MTAKSCTPSELRPVKANVCGLPVCAIVVVEPPEVETVMLPVGAAVEVAVAVSVHEGFGFKNRTPNLEKDFRQNLQWCGHS